MPYYMYSLRLFLVIALVRSRGAWHVCLAMSAYDFDDLYDQEDLCFRVTDQLKVQAM